MPNLAYIYALLDPDSKVIRYVGCSQNPQDRLYGHLREAILPSRYNPKKNNWLRSLIQQNKRPLIKILDEVSDRKVEYFYIFKHLKTVYNSESEKMIAMQRFGKTTPAMPLRTYYRNTVIQRAESFGRSLI
jgi:hypothetical protein